MGDRQRRRSRSRSPDRYSRRPGITTADRPDEFAPRHGRPDQPGRSRDHALPGPPNPRSSYGYPGPEQRGHGGRGQWGRGQEQGPSQAMMRPLGTAGRPGTMHRVATKEAAHQEVQQRLSQLSLQLQDTGRQQRVQRRGMYGRAGKRIQVLSNYFRVDCALKEAHQWDVTVAIAPRGGGAEGGPRRPPPREAKGARPLEADTCRLVMEALHHQYEKPDAWFFDGRKVLVAPSLPTPLWRQHEDKLPVRCCNADGVEKDFLVSLKYAATVSLRDLHDLLRGRAAGDSSQAGLQALDIALKHCCSLKPDCFALPMAMFFDGAQRLLPGGVEVWLGHSQSLRACQAGLMLNLNPTPCVFWAAVPVEKFLKSIVGPNALAPDMCVRAGKKLQGLKVRLEMDTPKGRRVRGHKAKGLARFGADQCMFMNEAEGREMSVAEYYVKAYGVRLQRPDLPCVDVGSPKKPVLLPMELTHIARGQRQKLNVTQAQKDKMLEVATLVPSEHLATVQRNLRSTGIPSQARLAHLQMSVSDKPLQLEARQLRTPKLQYGPVDAQTGVQVQTQLTPEEPGKWNMSRRNLAFFFPAQLYAYAIVSCLHPGQAQGKLEPFIDALLRKMGRMGLSVPQQPQPPIAYFNPSHGLTIGEVISQAADNAAHHFQKRPDMIFVLMKRKSSLYAEAKRASDSFLGIPSQCIAEESSKMLRGPPNDQYLANLAMKINVKLGGINVKPVDVQRWQNAPFMIIGADVTHPTTFNTAEPSIAALVGSLDNYCGHFATRVSLQGHRLEIIQNLKDMMLELLEAFFKRWNRKHKPMTLLFFRDGVSEGELATVQAKEIPQIFDACATFGRQTLGEPYAPKLTFIVARKRHGTRLYPLDRQTCDRDGNLFPGTVVDTAITSPSESDFFLISQAGLHGTSRPTHYHVVLDQNELSQDEIQEFSYHMCYLYCRCTRSVSVCPPAYYAHLAAKRARVLLTMTDVSETGSVASGVSATEVEFASVNEKLLDTMYYI